MSYQKDVWDEAMRRYDATMRRRHFWGGFLAGMCYALAVLCLWWTPLAIDIRQTARWYKNVWPRRSFK